MDKWSAGIDYAEGALGKSAIYGLKSREEAITWVTNASADLRLYLEPSCWIRKYKGKKLKYTSTIFT